MITYLAAAIIALVRTVTQILFHWIDNRLIIFRLGKHDCWEFDSGARDLSPEPSTLQRLIDSAGGGTNTGNLLQLANKVSGFCRVHESELEFL